VLRLFGMALALVLAAAPAAAEEIRAVYSARLYGAPVGQVIMAYNDNGRSYAASGHFRTTGLVGLLARVRFTMKARGNGTMLDMNPTSYSEDIDTGYRTSAIAVDYAASDRRIDPLSALLAGLMDRPAESGCAFQRETWDGQRKMRVIINAAETEADGDVLCQGVARRVSGYTEKEMANATEFPFTIRFAPKGGVLEVQRMDIVTIHGRVALVRR